MQKQKECIYCKQDTVAENTNNNICDECYFNEPSQIKINEDNITHDDLTENQRNVKPTEEEQKQLNSIINGEAITGGRKRKRKRSKKRKTNKRRKKTKRKKNKKRKTLKRRRRK